MSTPYIGTLVSVFHFLNDENYTISIKVLNGECTPITTLSKGRIYNIPAFQREIRWEEKHISELVHDISNGKIFIGNIILSKNGTNYDVIDGQQRITCLRMLIEYIYYSHSNHDALPSITPCKLTIESFKKYSDLSQKHYDTFLFSEENKKAIEESDIYHQTARYQDLWNSLKELPELRGNTKLKNFLKALKKCQLNVIIIDNEDNDDVMPIEYFISVNQKGVKLDNEDILKGFLFQYNSNLASEYWKKIKKNCFAINYASGKFKKTLLVTDLFEQYYYCRLYDVEETKKLSFNSSFLLTEDFSIIDTDAEETHTYYKGTHLLEVLSDLTRSNGDNLSIDIKAIERVSYLFKHFICDSYPEELFKSLVNPILQSSRYKISESGIRCYAHLIQHVLLSNEKVPKILVMKYLLNILDDKAIKECTDETQLPLLKEKYETIFPVFTLATLFSMFSGSKVKEKLYPYVSGNDWIQSVYEAIYDYSSSGRTVKGMTTFSYKIFVQLQEDEENTRRDQYRIKSLAGLYNFLLGTNENGHASYKFCTPEKMYNFFANNQTEYTLEHFLLNDSRAYCLAPNQPTKKYPAIVNKYIGSIYNFIYIHKEVNGGVLGNCVLPAKVEILSKSGTAYDLLTPKEKAKIDKYPITCQYSQAILNALKKKDTEGNHILFPLYWEAYEKDCAERQLTRLSEYFKYYYEDEYKLFVDKANDLFSKKMESEARKHKPLVYAANSRPTAR